VAALVVNRVHPHFGPDRDEAALRARADEVRQGSVGDRAAAERLALRYDNLADYSKLAHRERAQAAGVGDRIGAGVVAYVPSLAHDVVDFAALDAVALHLLEPQQSGIGGE
jgi:hypothetical protein